VAAVVRARRNQPQAARAPPEAGAVVRNLALVAAVIRPRVSFTMGFVELELLLGAAGHISLQDRQRHTQFGLIAEKVAIQK